MIAQAEIDVAEQKKRSDIEKEKRKTESRKSIAELDAAAVVTENTNAEIQARSGMALKIAQAECDRDAKRAEIESAMMAERKRIELDTENANLRRAQEEAVRRSHELAEATVKAESDVRAANGSALREIELARGEAGKSEALAIGEAKATEARARAEANAVMWKADADLHAALKAAEGIQAKLEAEAAGLAKLYQAVQIAPDFAKLNRVLDSQMPIDIAKASAEGLKNLSPKMSFFLHGEGARSSTSGDPLGPLRQLGLGLLPALKAFEDYTGVRIPGISPAPSNPRTPPTPTHSITP